VNRAWSWGEVVTVNNGTANLASGATAAFADVALTYEVGAQGSRPSSQYEPEARDDGDLSAPMGYRWAGRDDLAFIGGEPDLRTFGRAARLSQSIAAFGGSPAAGGMERHSMMYSIEHEDERTFVADSGSRFNEQSSVTHLL
jgi:hypothetical protein